jgi:hypothetical protein
MRQGRLSAAIKAAPDPRDYLKIATHRRDFSHGGIRRFFGASMATKYVAIFALPNFGHRRRPSPQS